MEGADNHLRRNFLAGEGCQSFAHFPGGLVGESDGQDRIRCGFAVSQQQRNPVGECAGFAGSRPGENEQVLLVA